MARDSLSSSSWSNGGVMDLRSHDISLKERRMGCQNEPYCRQESIRVQSRCDLF